MTNFFLLVCFFLMVDCAIAQWGFVHIRKKWRRELWALVAEQQKIIGQRHQLQTILAHCNLQERELTDDCRRLSEELSELQAGIKQLEAQAKNHRLKKQRPTHEETGKVQGDDWLKQKGVSMNLTSGRFL